MRRILMLVCATCVWAQTPFDARWYQMKQELSPAELYALLWDLPKGGDLHNHHEYSIPMSWWLERAAQKGYLTRATAGKCGGDDLAWETLRSESVAKLSACEQREFKPVNRLSGRERAAWLDALTLSGSESRDEFFERLVPRLGDLEYDAELMADALVVAQRQLQAEHAIYLETQADPRNFAGLAEDQGAKVLRERLARPDALATGVAVRMQVSTLRFGRRAEDDLRNGFAFVHRNRDLWTAVNLVGREDDPRGRASRFESMFREMRAQYPDVQISLHAGETAEPGSEVADAIRLGATRIGHGINALRDPQSMELLRSGSYLIEINLVSNLVLGYTPDLAAHPFREYLRQGIPVCLNTDDRGALQSNLTDDYFLAVTRFNLNWGEILRIGRLSLMFSFAEEDLKKQLLARYDESMRRFESKYLAEDWRKRVRAIKAQPSVLAKTRLLTN